MKHFVKTPSCRSCLPTFDPSRPKTVPEEMKLGEDDSGEAQARISPEQLVCQQVSSSSQVRLSFSNVNIDVVLDFCFLQIYSHINIYLREQENMISNPVHRTLSRDRSCGRK